MNIPNADLHNRRSPATLPCLQLVSFCVLRFFHNFAQLSFVHFNLLPWKTNHGASNLPVLQFGLGSSDFCECNALGDVRLDFVPFQELAETLEVLFERLGVFLEVRPDVNVFGIGHASTPEFVDLRLCEKRTGQSETMVPFSLKTSSTSVAKEIIVVYLRAPSRVLPEFPFLAPSTWRNDQSTQLRRLSSRPSLQSPSHLRKRHQTQSPFDP